MKKQFLTIIAIASLATSASAQQFIANAGFENWGASYGEEVQPTNWVSYNIFTAPIFDQFNTNDTSVVKAGPPDNYQGNFSAKITTIDLVTNPSISTIPNTGGYLMVGSVSITPPYIFSGYQFTSRPTNFTYATKYTPVGSDTAWCLVQVTHWNSALSHRDTVGLGLDYIAVTLSSYQIRNVNLNYVPQYAAVIPDTATIYFSASSSFSPQVGSVMYVDALGFSGYNSVNEIAQDNSVSVYPNPSSTITNFDVVSENAYEVAVYDMTGREINRVFINNKSAHLDSKNMAEGVYSYCILNKENEVLNRGKFAVVQ